MSKSRTPQTLDPEPEAVGTEREPIEISIDATKADVASQEPCASIPLPARIEALLVAADRPLAEGRLEALLGLSGTGSRERVAQAIAALNSGYEKESRAFRAERCAGGWQILTLPEYAPLLAGLDRSRQQGRLSQAALETLAVVAYRQPILRAEIEAIRGVSCGEVLRGLLERRMVKISGRSEELGRPMLYGTTKQFLEVFGLAGLEDLPPVDGLERRA